MRGSLELFEKTLEDYSQSKNFQNHLLDLIESLHRDLQCERNTTESLQMQIRNLMKQDTFGVTSKFAALKADYASLKEKLAHLRNENDDLNIQLIAKNQEAKQLLAEKEEEMRVFYAGQLKQRDDELKTKQREVESSKQNMKQKEQQLYSEIQTNKAVSDMELSNLEEDFRKQLNESSQKLKDSMNTCNVLRLELRSVKEQFNEYKRASNEKLSELQKRVREVPTSEIPSPSREEDSWNSNIAVSISSDDKFSKYQPLNVVCKNLWTPSDKPINLKKVPVYRGSPRNFTSNVSVQSTSSTLPPLKQLKDNTNKENKTVNRKRKLYNPDDFSYLNPNLD